jgi:NAD(P) transhydrogenase subunit alpha
VVSLKFKNMTIGIPKEIMEGENRVAAIPETVAKMVEQGAKVFIQSNAGKGSHIEDNDYKQVGAEEDYGSRDLRWMFSIILETKKEELQQKF